MECCWRAQVVCPLGVTQEVEMKVSDVIAALQKMDQSTKLEVINADGELASIEDVEAAISGEGPGVQVNVG